MENEDEEWIESPTGWGLKEDDDNILIDIFAASDNQKEQLFTYRIQHHDADEKTTITSKTVQLRGFKLDSDETSRSTGVTLWQASPRLSDYLQSHPESCIRDKSVLELGAGLGLCGITAYYLGARTVVMTDGDTQTLHQMRENVKQNCVENDVVSSEPHNHSIIVCKQLIWGSPNMEKFGVQHGQFDTIIGADIIYTQDSLQPLFDTVTYLLKKPAGQFILSRYSKWNNVTDEVVIEAAKLRGLECTRPSDGIFVFRWNTTHQIISDNMTKANACVLSDNNDDDSSLLIQVSNTLPSLESIQHFLSSSSPGCGAVSLFVGITRNNFEGKIVSKLVYEGYIPMAIRELRTLCYDARVKYPSVERLVAVHILGQCPVGEASVIVGCNSPHRRESMHCTEYLIDELKARVPIWKLEVYEGDERSVWKENVEWRNGRRWRGMVKMNEDANEPG
jgi:molybdopterin synthase catalytic subunit